MGISTDCIRMMVVVHVVVIESFKLSRPQTSLLLPLPHANRNIFDDKHARNAMKFDHKQDTLIQLKCMRHNILMFESCIYVR